MISSHRHTASAFWLLSGPAAYVTWLINLLLLSSHAVARALLKMMIFSNISNIINTSEEKIKKYFKDEINLLFNKIQELESSLSNVQLECVRRDNDIAKMKEIIVDQQLLIEKHEPKHRANNLIVHNIPEDATASGEARA